MKKHFSLILILASQLFFSTSIAEENYRIQNDLYYEEVYQLANSIEVVSTVNNQMDEHYIGYFDKTGNATKMVFFENNQDNNYNLKKPEYIFVLSELKNNERTIVMADPIDNSLLDMSTEKWLNPNLSINESTGMITHAYSNQNGSLKRIENTYLLTPKYNEILNYVYIEKDENKSQTLIANLPEGEKLVFVTTLEADDKGSWIKRVEEEVGGQTTIKTRIIDYIK